MISASFSRFRNVTQTRLAQVHDSIQEKRLSLASTCKGNINQASVIKSNTIPAFHHPHASCISSSPPLLHHSNKHREQQPLHPDLKTEKRPTKPYGVSAHIGGLGHHSVNPVLVQGHGETIIALEYYFRAIHLKLGRGVPGWWEFDFHVAAHALSADDPNIDYFDLKRFCGGFVESLMVEDFVA